MAESKTILFVCSGNTCRSSMAAALAYRILEELGGAVEIAGTVTIPCTVPGVRVLSAGTCALPGYPASPQAIECLAEIGLDLGSHRTAPLNWDLVRHSCLVLTMTGRHRDEVLRLAPEVANKVFILKEYAGLATSPETKAGETVSPAGGLPASESKCNNPYNNDHYYDILDPFGGDLEDYRACRDELARVIRPALERFLALKKDEHGYQKQALKCSPEEHWDQIKGGATIGT